MNLNLDRMQQNVRIWVVETFGLACLLSKKERAFRALEEATEAVQAFISKEEALMVIDQVYNKPVEPELYKEVGGALFTMIALAEANNLNAQYALQRTYNDALEIDPVKIITKHLNKPARDTSLDIHLQHMLAFHKENKYDKNA